MAVRTSIALIPLLSRLLIAAASGPTGAEACGRCHLSEYRGFERTAMARSFAPVSLQTAPELQHPVQFIHPKTGRHYRIFPRQGQFSIQEFMVGPDGKEIYSDLRTVSKVIGSGNHAQSFLVARGQQLYQAPVTFYPQIPSWDMSPGYDTETHIGFTRRVDEDCLFCHTERGHAISCERCHGLGAAHASRPAVRIVNPKKLQPALRVEVCDQCHLFGAARVVQQRKKATDYRPGAPLASVFAIFDYAAEGPRAQKVTGHSAQMKQSRCWQMAPDRLWCGSCHDVHAAIPAVEKTAFYRTQCLACHATRGCTRHPDPSNGFDRANDCTGCHMAKRPVMESAHVTFTDHEISRFPRTTTGPENEFSKTTLQPVLGGSTNRDVETRNLGFAELQLAASTGKKEYLRRGVARLETISGSTLADVEFWQDLGSARLQLQQTGKAEAAFRKAIELAPKSAGIHYSLGFLYQMRKELPKAIAEYQQAVTSDPEMALAWGNLAAAWLAAGKPQDAIRALDSALRLDPGNLEWRKVWLELKTSTPR